MLAEQVIAEQFHEVAAVVTVSLRRDLDYVRNIAGFENHLAKFRVEGARWRVIGWIT